METNRLHSLDFFRGIAIILVVLSHVFYIYGFDYASFFGVGRYGVALFYIVSGFTIYYVLVQREKGLMSLSSFYIRRFFRIAPLFYLLLLVIYLYSGELSLFWWFFVGYLDPLTFNNVLHVEWSIYVEVLFYLMAPFLFVRYRFNMLFLLFVFFLSSVAWRFFYYDYLLSSSTKEFYSFHPVNNLYLFFMGGCLFNVVSDKRPVIGLGLSSLILVAFLMFVLVFKFYLKDRFFLLADYMFSVVFVMAIYIKFIFFPNLRSPVVEFFGVISYSLYLLHYVVLQHLARFSLFESDFFDLIVGLLIVTIVSFLTYKFIERGGVFLGARFFK